MPIAQLSDVALRYEIVGSGEPVLLVAGLGGSAGYWAPNVDAFAARHQVVLHDHRGTGGSTRSEMEYSVELLADDLLRLMDHLKIDKAHLVGHSTGGAMGIVLGAKAAVYRSVEFIVDFFRSTPATAMFPLFLLLFGLGDLAKIAVAAFAAWLVIVFNVAYGVMNARQTRILAARSMGASSLRIFRDVIFFETLPQTFIGLRTAVSLALVVIIVAEMFIGATDGMGHRIIDAQISYSLTDMYGSILIAGAMGYGLNLILLFLERSIVHWSGK